jgi:hypothetical protein
MTNESNSSGGSSMTRQIEANRRNASKSTAARTPDGKQRPAVTPRAMPPRR